MTAQQQPDPVALWLSHAIVGAVAAALVGPKAGPQAAMLAALIAMAAHHYFDAPVAQRLADIGI